MKIEIDVRCATCHHRDHSGVFTPGGAKPICGHPDAVESFYPFDAGNIALASRLHTIPATLAAFPGDTPETTDPCHWRFRVIDPAASEPPAQCPLRKFKV